MYAKLMIKSELEVLTGMHIGGYSTYSAIGAVDSPVIDDPKTKRPIIPGSSLKGKLRTLLVRSIVKDITNMPDPNDDPESVRRLFGSGATGNRSKNNGIIKSRLQFSDAFICNPDEFKEIGFTEVKFENTIDRKSGRANPRQIERVIKGVKFEVNILYDLEDEAEFIEDMENLSRAMKLLQLDYLGGHGTRGSGRISFRKINLIPADDKDGILAKHMDRVSKLFKDVEDYELFSM